MRFVKVKCQSGLVMYFNSVQNEGGASTQRRIGASPQHVVFLQSKGDPVNCPSRWSLYGYSNVLKVITTTPHPVFVLCALFRRTINWQPRNWQIVFLGTCLSWWDWAQGKVHPSHLAIKWRVGDKSNQNKKRKICFCPKKHWEIISSRV